jgi:hypothetical protein
MYGKSFPSKYAHLLSWLRDMGYSVLVKTRGKGKMDKKKDKHPAHVIDEAGKKVRWDNGDKLFEEVTHFPNTSMELLQGECSATPCLQWVGTPALSTRGHCLPPRCLQWLRVRPTVTA